MQVAINAKMSDYNCPVGPYVINKETVSEALNELVKEVTQIINDQSKEDTLILCSYKDTDCFLTYNNIFKPSDSTYFNSMLEYKCMCSNAIGKIVFEKFKIVKIEKSFIDVLNSKNKISFETFLSYFTINAKTGSKLILPISVSHINLVRENERFIYSDEQFVQNEHFVYAVKNQNVNKQCCVIC
jgi:hypothetical protein